MPYLFLEPITNFGVYQDQDCMENNPTIHLLDNGTSEYSASVMREHFDTAMKTADLWGQAGRLRFCVKLRSGWRDLKDDEITDYPTQPRVSLTNIELFDRLGDMVRDTDVDWAENFVGDEEEGEIYVKFTNIKKKETPMFRMSYECICGEEWEMEHECCCNDRCPKCDTEIEPREVEDV